MNRNDWFLLLALSVVAGIVYLTMGRPTAAAQEAVVSVGGQRIRVLPLNQDAQLEDQGVLGSFTVVIEQGAARMASSTCPDQLCVKQGAVSAAGHSVICLPNQVAVVLSGDSGLDAVVR